MKRNNFVYFLIGILTLVLVKGQGCSKYENSEDAKYSSLSGCSPGAGATGSPKTIGEAVKLINSLPKPVTVSCLLESLDKPFKINMTSSPMSAQPAGGALDPRILIFNGDLIISVVPSGPGAKVVEFGELESPSRSLKGELEFPVEAKIEESAPFTKIKNVTGTTCSACHNGESASTRYVDAFSSGVIRPDLNFDISINEMLEEWAKCDRSIDEERCNILDAIYAEKPPVRQEF